VLKLAVQMTAAEWQAAWRPRTGRLVLPAAAPPRLRQQVAARIQLSGLRFVATVLGTVVSAHREEALHRVEIATAPESDPAVRMLDAASRGGRVPFQKRALRYLVKVPTVVADGEARVLTTAVSISEGGCALRWSGAAPSLGTSLSLHLGMGRAAVAMRGVVCWRNGSGPGARTGIRFVDGHPGSVRHLLDDARRAGAPEA
jgi:hypothetical protein